MAFLELVDETEASLDELEFDDDFYWEVFPSLRLVAQRSLSNLHTKQSNLTRPITEETLTLLRVIAAELGKKKPDPKIDEEALREIQAEVDDLFETVNRTDIERKLKRFMLSLTAAMLQGIQQYRIGGPEALEHALIQIIRQILLNLDLIDRAKADERTKDLWARFYKITVKFLEVVKFASDTRKTIEAISPIIRLLGGGPDDIPPVDLDGPNKH